MPLTADYAGTSKEAMYWKGRVYFASDRDGTMNLWSMDEGGKNLRQHTRHEGWDVASPSLQEGRIVYQLGADLHLFDTAAGKDRKLEIFLPSDFDQLRERWVKAPQEYLTSADLSPDGSRLVLTARGRAFVVPVKQGRLVDATGPRQARIRYATLLPDKKKPAGPLHRKRRGGGLEDAGQWHGSRRAPHHRRPRPPLERPLLPGRKVGRSHRQGQSALAAGSDRQDPEEACLERVWLQFRPRFPEHCLVPRQPLVHLRNQCGERVRPDLPLLAGQRQIHASHLRSLQQFECRVEQRWQVRLFPFRSRIAVGDLFPLGYPQPDPYFDRSNKIYQIALQERPPLAIRAG